VRRALVDESQHSQMRSTASLPSLHPASTRFPARFSHCVAAPLVALLSVAYSLGYAAYLTLDSYRQSAKRHSIPTSGWHRVLKQMATNVTAYANFYAVFLPEWAHDRIVEPAPAAAAREIHPGNWLLGLLTFLWTSVACIVVLVAMGALKLLPVLGRAYLNHFKAAGDWFRSGGKMIAGWVGFLFLLPVLAVMALPAGVFYGVYVGYKAGGAVLSTHGQLAAALPVLKSHVLAIHKASGRYISGQDVPFVKLPAAEVSFPWLMAGTLPFLVGLVLLPLPLLCLGLLFIMPCMVRGDSGS